MHKKGVGVAIPNNIKCTKRGGGPKSEQIKMHSKGVGVANPNKKNAQKGVGVANPNKVKCTKKVWGSQN